MKKIILYLLVVIGILGVSACGNTNTNVKSESKGTVVVGSKNFTESQIVSEIYALALEDNGYTVTRKFSISSSVIHQAIVSGQIDLYPEYTGTALLSVLKHDLITDPDEVYAVVKDGYKKDFDIVWLDKSAINDSQALIMLKSVADEYGIKTISDLQKNADKISFATQGEFDQREDGLPALTAAYGDFNFKTKTVYESSLILKVLASGNADLGVGYTTDGRLSDSKYVVLEDDKKVWPPYNLAPIVRQDTLDKDKDIADILNKVSAKLDTKTIVGLNAKVDVDKNEVDKVAKDFYNSIK